MGKRTIARAFAKSYCTALCEVDSKLFEQKGDLSLFLTGFEKGEALVILNAQTLKEQLVRALTTASSEFRILLSIGAGPNPRIHPFYLNRFTLIATAPTESSVHSDLLKCFSLRLTLKPYTLAELESLISSLLPLHGLQLTSEVISQVARMCGGSPNTITQLLRRLERLGGAQITLQEATELFSAFGLNPSTVVQTGVIGNFGTLSGVDFERIVTSLLAKMGFQAEMTKSSGDGGIDIVASLRKPIVGGRYLIQCKRFDPATQIGAPLIREFYGALVADRTAIKGIFVTTSTFTTQARDFARNLPLELIDGSQLQVLLEEFRDVVPKSPEPLF